MADPDADASNVQLEGASSSDAPRGDLAEFEQLRGETQDAHWRAMELRDRASGALDAVGRLPLRHEEVMGLQMKSPPIQLNQSQVPVAQPGGFKSPPAQMMGE